MSTMSPHDVTGLAAKHFERWRRLHEERRFRVEQLDALDLGSTSGDGHASVSETLRCAATIALREIDSALARMDEGRYGLCVSCFQPLPDSRLDVLPMAPLCISCHFHEDLLTRKTAEVAAPQRHWMLDNEPTSKIRGDSSRPRQERRRRDCCSSP